MADSCFGVEGHHESLSIIAIQLLTRNDVAGCEHFVTSVHEVRLVTMVQELSAIKAQAKGIKVREELTMHLNALHHMVWQTFQIRNRNDPVNHWMDDPNLRAFRNKIDGKDAKAMDGTRGDIVLNQQQLTCHP